MPASSRARRAHPAKPGKTSTRPFHIVLAAEVQTVGADFGHFEPMLDAAQRELAAAGVDETPGVLLADAG